MKLHVSTKLHGMTHQENITLISFAGHPQISNNEPHKNTKECGFIHKLLYEWLKKSNSRLTLW